MTWDEGLAENRRMKTPVDIIQADLERADHQRDIVALTAVYALDPMGNGGPLPAETLAGLIAGLKSHPTTLIFLAYVDGKAVAIATCFRGFSTFFAKPLINIHDLAVLPAHRGRGIGRKLLDRVAAAAREAGCCKVTLEVQEKNTTARHLYEECGFAQAVYGKPPAGALFYTKPL
jgi:ribosomal protein S18 acetylase RimI-like enzyme